MHNKIYSLLLTAIVFLFAASECYTQNYDRLIIEHADSLVGTSQGDDPYRIYEGNVFFINGDVKVKCDKATHYFARNTALLVGNVRIMQDELTMRSPYVIYNGNSKTAYAKRSVEIIDGDTYLAADSGRYNTDNMDAFFMGNVFIEDDSALIYTDYVHHNRGTEVSHAFGNSFIRGKFTNAMILADSISNFPGKSYTLANGNPILVQIDSLNSEDEESRFDTLMIVSEVMEAFRKSGDEKYFFKDSVEIYKSSVQTKAGKAFYAKDKNYIRLTEKPVVWYDSTQLKADSIIIRTRDNELRSIETFNNAIAMVKNDSTYSNRINQVSGDSLKIDFYEGAPVELTSYDNARTLYFLIDKEGPSGAELKNTDKVVLTFKDGKIKLIKWIGTTNGEYYPENITNQNPEKYNLPLFDWRNDKPLKRELNTKYIK